MPNIIIYNSPVSLPHTIPANIRAWSADVICLAFFGKEMVVRKDHEPLDYQDLVRLCSVVPTDIAIAERDCACIAIGIATNDVNGTTIVEQLPEDYTLCPIRIYNAEQSDDVVTRISRAKALTEWVRNTKFCPHCGKTLMPHPTLSAIQCLNCSKIHFPRIEPCIIVLVTDGDKMLLARHVQRNQDIYACIAGFMEAGETAEQAVRREIMEETGLTVKNIRYFGSQSWPFPTQLMIAFTAEYDSGELKIQESEIEHAAWFGKDNCPATPQPGSIAYRMINWFKDSKK